MMKQLLHATKGMLNTELVKTQVAKQWRKKAKCLENLTNENIHELKKLDLQLLKGLKYKGLDTEPIYKTLKESTEITTEQHLFAKFLYDNYPAHSTKIMGFE